MKDEKDRKTVLSNMKSIRQVFAFANIKLEILAQQSFVQLNCVLRVFDTEITVEERIEAWKSGGGSMDQYEMLRWNGFCKSS